MNRVLFIFAFCAICWITSHLLFCNFFSFLFHCPWQTKCSLLVLPSNTWVSEECPSLTYRSALQFWKVPCMTHFINGFLLSPDSIHRGTEGWQYPLLLSVRVNQQPFPVISKSNPLGLKFSGSKWSWKSSSSIYISSMIDGGGHAPPVFVGNHGEDCGRHQCEVDMLRREPEWGDGTKPAVFSRKQIASFRNACSRIYMEGGYI